MSLYVPSSLLPPAGDSKEAQRFVLASSEWLDLQTRVQAVLALPSDIGEYEERYGDPSSGSHMKECFDAMHRLQKAASRYGSPKRLRARILNDPISCHRRAAEERRLLGHRLDARTGAPGRVRAGRNAGASRPSRARNVVRHRRRHQVPASSTAGRSSTACADGRPGRCADRRIPVDRKRTRCRPDGDDDLHRPLVEDPHQPR